MADTKISALTDGGVVVNTDVFPVVRAGANRKVTALASSNPSISSITYTDGLVTAYVEGGVTYTITYNADGTVNTFSDGTTTRTATYNGDGTLATLT